MLGDRKTYVFEEDSIVYFLTSDFDDFQILYNFKAPKRDSWTLKFKNRESIDSIVVQIDSVYSTAINGKELIKQNVSYFYTLKSLKIPSVIVERIGDLFYLFNFYDFHIACDVTYTTGLRCYHDDFIGYYNTSAYGCDYTNVSTKEITVEDCRITPNPCLDYFTVYNVDNTLCKYCLVNSYGCLMSEDKVNAGCTQVDMSKFSPGIYFVKLYGTKGLNKVVKVLKNGL